MPGHKFVFLCTSRMIFVHFKLLERGSQFVVKQIFFFGSLAKKRGKYKEKVELGGFGG